MSEVALGSGWARGGLLSGRLPGLRAPPAAPPCPVGTQPQLGAVPPRLTTPTWRHAAPPIATEASTAPEAEAPEKFRRKWPLSGETQRRVGMWWWVLLALAGLGRALPDGAETEPSAGGSAPISGEAVRYRTAEMADAVLGSEPPGQPPPVVLSAVPGEGREGLTAETCEAAAGGGGCGAGSGPAALPASSSAAVALETVLPAGEEPNGTAESAKTPKVSCEERNVTGINNFTLQILNVSQDLMEFLNPNSSDCTLVLFYTPWCRFSVSLAPHFNSLPRAFPTLHFLALDASQHSSLSTRFGTVAVPNILLFQGAKPMARFNHTDRTLETLKDFIFNQTGIEAKNDVTVTEEDWKGPLPSVLTKGVDWLLLFSVLFLASFILYATVRTESIRWLIPGQEHEHQE
ncbi:thioredoxin domain-containing protein 15 [Cyrtonyx montezumae]|uniref:thioredoxin domain-containing protein 15 n=1 Tax=Cyrtonyx montezumae TaxID=9017 RepID=UPI0032DA884D